MTVEQFKSWFDGFTDALQLDLVNGFDSSDLEDVFNKIKEKLAEIEVPATVPTASLQSAPFLPTPQYPIPMPVYTGTPPSTPDINFTNGKGVTTVVDRLAPTWSQSGTCTWTYNPDELAPRRG